MRRNGGNGVPVCLPRSRDMASALICERMILLLASASVIPFFAGPLDHSPPPCFLDRFCFPFGSFRIRALGPIR